MFTESRESKFRNNSMFSQKCILTYFKTVSQFLILAEAVAPPSVELYVHVNRAQFLTASVQLYGAPDHTVDVLWYDRCTGGPQSTLCIQVCKSFNFYSRVLLVFFWNQSECTSCIKVKVLTDMFFQFSKC